MSSRTNRDHIEQGLLGAYTSALMSVGVSTPPGTRGRFRTRPVTLTEAGGPGIVVNVDDNLKNLSFK